MRRFTRAMPAFILMVGLTVALTATAPQCAHADSTDCHFGASIAPAWGATPSDPISISVFGRESEACWHVVDSQVVNQNRVVFTLRQEPACEDTTLHWIHTFQLGTYGVGIHPVTIVQLLEPAVGEPDSCVATVSFLVEAGGPPPPPPPPPTGILNIRGLAGYSTVPEHPNAIEPTTLVLWGWFPYPCGTATAGPASPPDTATTEAIDVGVTLTPGGPCDSMWTLSIPLGVLEAGHQRVRIQLTAWEDPETASPDLRIGALYLSVADSIVVPPPPPPPPLPGAPSILNVRGLSAWWTGAVAPNAQQPTTIFLHGWFPYANGLAEMGSIPGPDTLTGEAIGFGVVLSPIGCPGPTCGDSTWTLQYNLGFLPEGEHRIRVKLLAWEDPWTPSPQLRVGYFYLNVAGSPPPPPPGSPPPGDSLLASHPNPFTDAMTFSVMVEKSTPVEIGIFDVQGREVRSVFRGSIEGGTWVMQWDGKRDDGSTAAPGIYFYRMARPGRAISRRVVLLPR